MIIEEEGTYSKTDCHHASHYQPPTRPAARLSMMFPYRLGMTMTSNCCGLDTSCIVVLSTIIDSNSMLGYFSATSLQDLEFVSKDMCVVFCEDLFEVDLTGRQEIERLTTVLSLRLSFQM